MTFWIAAAALLGLTCLALLAALARGRGRSAAEGDHDRLIYDGQIAEVARQQELGLIGAAEAEAARAEAARRLLAAERRQSRQAGGPEGRRLAAVAVLVLTPAIALPVYLLRGSPEAPGFALASRPKPQPAADGQMDIAAAVSRIEAHLVKNPDDGRGHEVIAPVYLRLGRHQDAVRAYAAALRLLGPSAARHANLGEARVFAASGVVTAEARADFQAALAFDPRHVQARFFLALAAEQEGDRPRAIALLGALRDDLPEGELKAEIGRQLEAFGAVPKGGEAIAALPQDQRQAAIRDMVEGLARRLAAEGGPASDWARLIRALVVLGERERATAILAEARQKFAGNAEDLRLIEDAGKAVP